jgi:hypothetical protein
VERDGFPWVRVGLAAIMMDDARKAQRFLDWASQELTRNGHPYPWYVMESASAIELAKALDAWARAGGRGAE